MMWYIGLEHGKAVREQSGVGCSSTKNITSRKLALIGSKLLKLHAKFMPLLERDWSDFVAEMRGKPVSMLLNLDEVKNWV
jgi:hypothetical protein